MPMKPRIASNIIIRAMSSTATKAIGGRTLGAIRWKMIAGRSAQDWPPGHIRAGAPKA